MSKVAQLKDDLAYALAATEIRILAPIPGKTAVGVEVPNANRSIVTLGDVFGRAAEGSSPLTVWLGKDVSGKAIGADLAKMPHLLVAGTTGAGKSGCINAMLSLDPAARDARRGAAGARRPQAGRAQPLRGRPAPADAGDHLAAQAANALQNLVREMEWRYGIMSMARTRSLPELNKHRRAKGDEPLPYILCVIDELADLMMVAPADVEDSIIRIAQKARAVGIHLVLATQSPRVDVITGMIKANVPSRIAFAVSSQTDSRVILDQNGAESLLGMGDMLFSPVGSSQAAAHPGRLHRRGRRSRDHRVLGAPGRARAARGPARGGRARASAEQERRRRVDPDEDPLLGEAIALVVEMGTASTSMLQRRLRLGYTRAGRLIDMLERRGVISGYEGSKPRQVLVTAADLPRVLAALPSAATHAERRRARARAVALPPRRPARRRLSRDRSRTPSSLCPARCRRSGPPSARRACAPGSTSRRSRPRRRSARSTCARWRTRNGTCCRGPTYVKSFLRTYAEALGLDAKLLLEEYKLRHERLVRSRPAADRRRRGAPRRPRRRRRRGASRAARDRRGVVLALLAVLYRPRHAGRRRRRRQGQDDARRRRRRRRTTARPTTAATPRRRAPAGHAGAAAQARRGCSSSPTGAGLRLPAGRRATGALVRGVDARRRAAARTFRSSLPLLLGNSEVDAADQRQDRAVGPTSRTRSASQITRQGHAQVLPAGRAGPTAG